MPAGDGSLGPPALAAALAAAAGAVVPFIVAHLIALAVITVVTYHRAGFQKLAYACDLGR
jgi:hypothetical protein